MPSIEQARGSQPSQPGSVPPLPFGPFAQPIVISQTLDLASPSAAALSLPDTGSWQERCPAIPERNPLCLLPDGQVGTVFRPTEKLSNYMAGYSKIQHSLCRFARVVVRSFAPSHTFSNPNPSPRTLKTRHVDFYQCSAGLHAVERGTVTDDHGHGTHATFLTQSPRRGMQNTNANQNLRPSVLTASQPARDADREGPPHVESKEAVYVHGLHGLADNTGSVATVPPHKDRNRLCRDNW